MPRSRWGERSIPPRSYPPAWCVTREARTLRNLILAGGAATLAAYTALAITQARLGSPLFFTIVAVPCALYALLARRLLAPGAPPKPIIVHRAQDRPQPRLDVHVGNGMPVHCGRVRACPVLGYKLVALGHNIVRGAAGAALLNAELLVARGLAPASSGERRDRDATQPVGRT